VFLSSVIFLTYNFLGDWHDFKIKSYLGFIFNCSSVFIFPVVGTFFYFRYQSLRKKIDHILTTKEESIDPSKLISFVGQGSRDKISLAVSSFLYGRAQDNYVELYYMEQESLKKFLIRASLNKLIESIEHQAILRSHRSYMVNLYHVKSVKGGQNEFSLYLDPFDKAIPVSKTYKDIILDQLKMLKNFS
jgi:DNA-binding LytR/AlgR family response regulator